MKDSQTIKGMVFTGRYTSLVQAYKPQNDLEFQTPLTYRAAAKSEIHSCLPAFRKESSVLQVARRRQKWVQVLLSWQEYLAHPPERDFSCSKGELKYFVSARR